VSRNVKNCHDYKNQSDSTILYLLYNHYTTGTLHHYVQAGPFPMGGI